MPTPALADRDMENDPPTTYMLFSLLSFVFCVLEAADWDADVAWLMLPELATPSALLQVVSEVESVSKSLACEVTKRYIVAENVSVHLG